MTREQAIDCVKGELESYLCTKGINTRKPFNCLNPGHTDKNPSMSLNRERNNVHCFSCGATYDVIDLIGIDYGLSAADAFNRAYEMFNIHIDDNRSIKSTTSPAPKNKPKTDGAKDVKPLLLKAKQGKDSPKMLAYLQSRGISRETSEKFNLGYLESCYGIEAVVIPTGESSFTARNVNSCNDNERIRKGGKSAFFNVSALESGNPLIFIVEGEFDALSILECDYPAISLGSVSNVRGFADACKKSKFNGTLCLCLDNDDPGRKASKELQELLKSNATAFTVFNLSGDYKDPNERLIRDRAGFIEALGEAREVKAEVFINGKTHMPEDKTVDLINFNLDDLGNSERLLTVYGKDIRYSPELKKWFIWNGLFWELDESGNINRKVSAVIKSFQSQAVATVNELLRQTESEQDAENMKKALTKAKSVSSFANKSGFFARIDAMVKIASSHNFIMTSQLDVSANLIACLSGTIDLTSGALKPPVREDYITMLVNTEHKSHLTPVFDKFIREIFGDNAELIEFIQRALGYSITGLTKEQCFFICYGTGSNGKSTLFDIVSYILKDYCEYIPINVLLDNEKRSSEASPELARARGKRLVFATEGKEYSYLNENMIKTLTGGEKINVRLLHTNGMTYTPTFKIWLSTNHKPIIKGTDNGIWRRVKLVPFNVVIPPERQDKDLMRKLRTEAAGIFNWLIQGAVKYYQDGLKEPQAVKQATGEYQAEMDLLADFISDCLVQSDSNKFVKASTLFDVFEKWSKASGNTALSQTAFGRKLAEKGFAKKRSNSGNVYEGVKLSEYGENFVYKPFNPFMEAL